MIWEHSGYGVIFIDNNLAEADTQEQAYFAMFRSWPDAQSDLDCIFEVPTDRIMLMIQHPALPGFEVARTSTRKRWGMRSVFKKEAEYYRHLDWDKKKIEGWNDLYQGKEEYQEYESLGGHNQGF